MISSSWDPSRTRVIGALAAACLLAASFQPLNLGAGLGWFALVPLLHSLPPRHRPQAFALGWAFGLGVNLFICAALIPIPTVHWYQVLLICAYLACYPALWTTAVASWSPRSPAFLFFGASLWVALDYVKAHAGFLAFPVGSLGQTQVENTWLLQSASVFGEAAVTGLVVWGNLLIWRVLKGMRGIDVGWSMGPIVLALGFGALTGMPRSNAPGLQVAVLHTNFRAFGPGTLDTATRTRHTYEFLSRSMPSDARLIVLPETSFVNLSDDATRLAGLQAQANARQATLVAGVAQALKFDRPVGTVAADDLKVRAGAWIFDHGTREPRRYDKVHRLPFAEYLPAPHWVSWPEWLAPPPLEVMESAQATVYSTSTGWPVGIMVCWESVFAGHARTLAVRGAGVLLQLSNHGWFSNTSAGLKHNAIVRMRAVEMGRPIVTASNAGPAMIVDPLGRLVAESASTARMSWVTGQVWPSAALSVYSHIGDAFVAFCVAIGITAWSIEQRRTRRVSRRSHEIASPFPIAP